MKNARFVIDWDDTLVEDRYPEQGPWLPGAVEALHELERHGDIVIFSCRVAGYEFPSRRDAERDVPRDPADVERCVDAMRKMLDEVGLGHVEIWQRPYKPSATIYIDNKGVRFTGDWRETLEDVYQALTPVGDDLQEFSPEYYGNTTRHPNSQRFHEILKLLGDLHDRKQQDYGRGDDPFANVRGAEEWDVEGWVGAMIRANDKIRRLQQYARTGSLANEGVEDAFMDLAVYAVIAMVLWEQAQVSSGSPAGYRTP